MAKRYGQDIVRDDCSWLHTCAYYKAWSLGILDHDGNIRDGCWMYFWMQEAKGPVDQSGQEQLNAKRELASPLCVHHCYGCFQVLVDRVIAHAFFSASDKVVSVLGQK